MAMTNFVEMLAILAIPAWLTYTFGRFVGDTRQGWTMFAAMSVIFLARVGVATGQRSRENPRSRAWPSTSATAISRARRRASASHCRPSGPS